MTNVSKDIPCPHCHKTKTTKDGLRKTQNRGLIQRYRCKGCGHRFVPDDGFYRMRNAPQKITLCLDLFYRGVSTRKIQEHLQAFYPHNSSHKSIYKWVVKYSRMISAFTDSLGLQIGQEIQADEMEYHRRLGRNTHGIDRNWFMDIIDCKTRFMVASEYVQSRSQEEIKRLMLRARCKTGVQVKVCTTDAFMAYENIVEKSFGYNNRIGAYNVKHKKVNASRGEGFNCPIERLHNTIRQRTKTFRGFHGSVASANAIMKGMEIYYNFIRKHQAIGKCPYELATSLKLETSNKWLELIWMAVMV